MDLYWYAVGLNLLSCAVSCVVTLRSLRGYSRWTRELVVRPEYQCAMRGHDLKLDVITLDDQQPPEFRFTHVWKWTCGRCEFQDTRTLRQTVFAPGIAHIDTGWLRPPEEVAGE